MRAPDDSGRGQSADEPCDATRHRLGDFADHDESEGGARGRTDDGCDPGAHRVHTEEPGQDDAESESKAECEPERVPEAHLRPV